MSEKDLHTHSPTSSTGLSGAIGSHIEAHARQPLDWTGVVLFFLFRLHAGLYLIPRLPVTLWRLFQALRTNGLCIRDKDFLAFGERDVGFRPWYYKIAQDQRQVGRLGYVWDNGFGLPVNPSFYSNLITYGLYGWLGARCYVACSVVSFLAVTLILHGLVGNWLVGLLLAISLAGSPLFIGSQIHLGKPEILWWVFLPPMLVSCWLGYWLLAGFVFTLMALANSVVAFLAGVMLASAVSLFWPGWHSVGLLLVGMLPGLLKTTVRLVPFFRSRWLSSRIREQLDVVSSGKNTLMMRFRAMLSRRFLYYAGLYSVALVMIAATSRQPWKFLLLGWAVLLVYHAGQTLIYLNDAQSFWMWHIALLVSMLAVEPSWAGLAGFSVFLYMHPQSTGGPVPAFSQGVFRSGWVRWATEGRQALSKLARFPYLEPVSRQAVSEPIAQFFGAVPDGARILMESHSHDRRFDGYRTFLQICEEVLPLRQIELLPDEYVRISNMQFYDRIHAAFNAGASAGRLLEIAETVGAAFALAYSADFVRALERAGFARVAVLQPANLPTSTRRMLQLPERDLVLLAAPQELCQITPRVEYHIEGNMLSWFARAEQNYLVRYAYHRNFFARQGRHKVPVTPVVAAPGTDLCFMQVQAVKDGPLHLEFRRTWW